jgi:glycosyltransferase involved in cell wall biosynthesis
VDLEDQAAASPLLSLPERGNRFGEGGLRTRGRFKKEHDGSPLVTVVTVVYNGAEHLERTIRSIINQSYNNIEYIIIDGGSTDGTVDIIKKYDQTVDYWVSEPDNGIYDAMNKGVSLACGDWINFMNAGDIFSDETTLQQVFSDIMNYSTYDCIYSDTLFNYKSGSQLITCDIHKRRIIHQSIIYKKHLHSVTGPYLVADGVTISDYLFFMTNRDRKWVKYSLPISLYSPYGRTSGSDAFKQKIAVDVMLGFTGRVTAALLLVIHPLYHCLKNLCSLVARGRKHI